MAREQRFNNDNRQVINTIEDTSKYQTGDARRLKVVADPLQIRETPSVTGLTQLTQALGEVKPELMQWAVNKQSEDYTRAIEAGKLKAQTGGITEGEMEQYGFDSVKAVNDWTDWNQKTLSAYEQGFDKQGGNLEEFLKSQWETNPFQGKSEIYVNKFTPLAGKTMDKLREAQGKFTADRQELMNNTELTRMFGHDINDVMGAGQDYSVAQYEARRENLKGQFPGKTNSQLDELAYMAILKTAEETGDTTLFKVFKQAHADKTPGLYEIPKWKDKIDADVAQIISKKVAARTKFDTDNEKALKGAADVKEREMLFGLIEANGYDDPTVRDAKIAEIVAKAKTLSDSGIPISEAVIGKLMSASVKIDKTQETTYQSQNYATLRLSSPSNARIASAYASGDISLAGFDKLMNKRESAANKADKGEKPMTSNAFVKDAIKTIKATAGYTTWNMSKDGDEARKNADAVTARVLDHIDDLVDSGVSVKDAAAQGSAMGVKLLKDAGLDSKELRTANSKLDAVDAKRKDPVSFYKSNPTEYRNDNRNRTVPPMNPKDLLTVQRAAKAQEEVEKKLKQQGRSTK